eukprot:SAG22_NODE_37_length_26837_cov_8.103523_4_plen_250_part_00
MQEYQGAPESSSCIACAPGRYSDTLRAEECSDCQAGQFQADERKIGCIDCEMGLYSAGLASEACAPCPTHSAGFPPSGGATTCHCVPGSYFDATSGGELLDNETVGCTVCASVVPSESELVPKLICAGGAANATAVAAVGVYVIARPCTVTVDDVSQNVSCVTSYLCEEGVCLGPAKNTLLAAENASLLSRRMQADSTDTAVIQRYGGIVNRCRVGHKGLYCSECDEGLVKGDGKPDLRVELLTNCPQC